MIGIFVALSLDDEKLTLAALVGIGIPKDSVIRYETALKADKFLLVAHGTGDEVAKAEDIIKATGPEGVAVHPA